MKAQPNWQKKYTSTPSISRQCIVRHLSLPGRNYEYLFALCIANKADIFMDCVPCFSINTYY